jgi:hypothetical protein
LGGGAAGDTISPSPPRWSVVLIDLARERTIATDWVGLGTRHAEVVAATCGSEASPPHRMVVLVDLLAREWTTAMDWVGLGTGHAEVVAAACGSEEICGRLI